MVQPFQRVVQVPVILVGNKIDLRGGEVTNEALEDEIVPIMNEFKVRCVHFMDHIYDLKIVT
jgi:hypothetical protein